MKKIKVPVNSPRLKSKVLLQEIFIGKIIILQTSRMDIAFRKEFNIPWKGFPFDPKIGGYPERDIWILDPETGKTGYNYDRYIAKLRELAREFGFKDSEMISLEDYLQTGFPIIGGGDSVNIEKEKKYGKPTRSRETASLVIRVSKMRKNKAY